MKRKDLKLALVCYGGVSLAVYMHGVTKEILKLVRASKRLHAEKDTRRSEGEWDSEDVYLDLLRQANDGQSLRVVLDVIAGASAGGINGIMLARALAHDRPLDDHRTMWLELADAEALLEPTSASSPTSKVFMRPFLWLASRLKLNPMLPPTDQLKDPELQEKLSRFTRSKWFRPPFSGAKLSAMLLDGLEAMGPRRRSESLIPEGQRLDLFVTVTDFFGHAQTLPMHNPPRATEREHRHVLSFRFEERSGIQVGPHDFNDDCFPALAFAGRATSSFPGAFPAARITEMDAVLKDRGEDWTDRDRFLRQQFHEMIANGDDPAEAAFIDGSVLNNKPFAEAIDALKDRAADREVDRRIVYIDPDPGRDRMREHEETPGFFSMIRGALSEIPRTQPIRDELERMDQLAQRLRRLRQAVSAADSRVREELEHLFGGDLGLAHPTPETIAIWRREAHDRSRLSSGYAYNSYRRLKCEAVLARVIKQAKGSSRAVERSPRAMAIEDAFYRWAERRGVLDTSTGKETNADGYVPWIAFLRRYDMAFRRRRLHFLIRRINQCYRQASPEDMPALDRLKDGVYALLSWLAWPTEPVPNEPSDEDIDQYLEHMATGLNLETFDRETDRLIASDRLLALSRPARAAVLEAYLGFTFYDVVTLPLALDSDIDAFDDIKVDRISPEDATSLSDDGGVILHGLSFGKFGGFFSSTYRQHDYLWGRLNSAERLVDIVADAAPPHVTIDRFALKRSLFRAIVQSERPHLPKMAQLLDEVEARCREPECSTAPHRAAETKAEADEGVEALRDMPLRADPLDA